MCFDPFGSGCLICGPGSNRDLTSYGAVLSLVVGFAVVKRLGLVWGAYRNLEL